MTHRAKILAFAGSLREGSYNKKLLKEAIRTAEHEGAEVTSLDLRDLPLPIYDGDLEERDGLPPNAIVLKKLFWGHEGFIIASPEYNSSISGALKNAIDWASRRATKEEVYLSCFIDKVALLLSASPSPLGGLRGLVHLRAILQNISTFVLPDQKTIPVAHEAFDAGGRLKDPAHKHSLETLVKKFVSTIYKLNNIFD